MNFIYSKDVEIPEEIRAEYEDYRGIELALANVDESLFNDYSNGTILLTLVPRRNEKPRQILALLSRKHKTDVESLTQYVDALAGNERFLIDTLKDRVVEMAHVNGV